MKKINTLTEKNTETLEIHLNNPSDTATDLTTLELSHLRVGAKEFIDPKTKKPQLVGVLDRNELFRGDYGEWMSHEYQNYTPHPAIIKKLRQQLDGRTIEIFLATWCGDTRRELPRFIKILDAANFPATKVQLIALDRSKKTPDNLQAGKNIARVPTFIVRQNNKEIGRIIEKPQPGTLLEEALLALVH